MHINRLTALLVSLLVFVIALTFLTSHHSLHVAISHDEQYKFHSDRSGDWQAVFNLAKLAKDRFEFLSLLKAEGWLVSHDVANAKEAKEDANTGVSNHVPEVRPSSTDDYEDTNQIDNGPRDIIIDKETEGDASSSDQPPPLTAELARGCSVNQTIIVTWANNALLDFVLSWAHHVERVGISNILVGAMDMDIGKALVKEEINAFRMYEVEAKNASRNSTDGVGGDHLAWGGESFHKMGRLKIGLAGTFLGFNLHLLLVDVDVVILRNVMDYFARYPEADILVSSDNLVSTLDPGDQGLELPEKAGAPMNIGIMYFRWSSGTVKFVDTWLDLILKKPDLWDQLAFNDLARAGWDPYLKVHPKSKRIFLGNNDTLYVGVLPVAMFSGGHTYFIQRLHEVQMVEPYAVHCTFQYGGNIGKRNRMREAMIFEDNSTYYGMGGRESFVSFDLEKTPSMSPKEFKRLNYTQKKLYNIQGIDMQMDSVWPAMGLSHLFGRTLIMPKFTSYCDRYWTPLDDCRVPGALSQRLPFEAPMDYILDPIGMSDDASPDFQVSWREASFLANPRCPESIKRSKITIYSSKAASEVTERFSLKDGGLVVVLPLNISTLQLRTALIPYVYAKIWHFKNPSAVFQGFEDSATEEAFNRRTHRLTPVTQPLNETTT